jgi:putative tryptophan/tyrosine transport system substrate-binding protein
LVVLRQWPIAARGQQAERMRRIGVLVNLPEGDQQTRARLGILRQSLAKLDWLEGRNIHIDYRFSVDTVEQGEVRAKELMELQPEMILAHGTPAVAALRKVTRTVPIVFVVVSEPVAQGFVQSLSHPGGNITGLSYLEPSLGAKWLELLKELAPHVVRVATIYNPDTAPNAVLFLHSAQTVVPKFAVELIESPVRDPAGIEEAMLRLAHEPGGGLIILPDVFTGLHRKIIFERAAYHRLPAIYSFPNYAAEGGLISYGVNVEDLYRRAAAYVDHILRGDKPADLPVEQPTKFELVINLTTAKALGITVPQTLLPTAD